MRCRSEPWFFSLHALDAERVCFLEFGGQGGVWETLPSDGAAETEDGHGADGGAAAIRGGGKWATVDDAVADFDSGGKAVEDEASGAGLERVDEAAVCGKLGIGGVEAGGELAFEMRDGGFDFL